MEPTFWGKLISELQEEHGVSERKLARLSKVHRDTIACFKRGEVSMTVDRVERILAVFGYIIEPLPANPDDKEGKACRMQPRPSAHVVA